MEKFPYDFSTSAIRHVYTSKGKHANGQQPLPTAAPMHPLRHPTAQRNIAGKLPARPLAPL
jgi:hypothetical protein